MALNILYTLTTRNIDSDSVNRIFCDSKSLLHELVTIEEEMTIPLINTSPNKNRRNVVVTCVTF